MKYQLVSFLGGLLGAFFATYVFSQTKLSINKQPFLFFFLLLNVLMGVSLFIWHEQGRLNKKRQRFELRQSLSLEEIFYIYYLNSSINESQFILIWNEIADILQLDPHKLRPDDSFKHELAPVKGYIAEDEATDLEEYLIEKCQEKGIKWGSKIIETIDDCIKLIAMAE